MIIKWDQLIDFREKHFSKIFSSGNPVENEERNLVQL